MKKKHKKNNINKIKLNILNTILPIILFTIFILRIIYLSTADYKVGDTTIKKFIQKRNTKEEILLPTRGSIKDINGDVLAEDVTSYTVIAYLSPKRSENSVTPKHVVDKKKTAQELAPLIKADEKTVENILNKDAYQVELGPGSKNLSQIQMEEIKKLNLPGIDFVETSKRYYPNGDFASYVVGYTTNKEDKEKNVWKVGGLGIEEYYNDTLTGKSGYIRYEKDRYGYKIANGREYKVESDDGDDIYLTIDNNIELFTENAIKKMMEESKSEWGLIAIADAKTGAILAYSSSPSFDPNQRNITNYLDLLTGSPYEPGSTMKVFSYMCAIDSGKYDGNKTYESGSITYEAKDGNTTTIHDWNREGWGKISLDYGFAMSSNVGAATLLEEEIINKKKLSECYKKYGFGQKTGITIPRESAGIMNLKYDVDAASATFGQAITVTPIQIIQALTPISNEGKILKPYIVSKIVDTNTQKITYEATTEIIDTVVKTSTIDKMKSLMKSVVCKEQEQCTGSPYYMEDYPIIGKTGTAQLYDSKTGTYMKGESDYIYSFAGLYPESSPQIIMYAALKRPKDTTNYIAPAIKDVVVNISKYLNIVVDNNKISTYKIDNYLNKDVDTIASRLEENKLKVFILGTGKKIINQYPQKNTTLQTNSTVALLTNEYNKSMPNMIGLSYKDAINILKLMGVKYKLSGNGYVKEQNIGVGTIITDSDTVELKLSN